MDFSACGPNSYCVSATVDYYFVHRDQCQRSELLLFNIFRTITLYNNINRDGATSRTIDRV